MKTINQGIIGAAALLLASAVQTSAVVDQALEVQGTNLVLSWPSLGYEYYMIQYWPELTAPWQQLTNCYHANSTNRTTFIVPCCALAALGGSYSASSQSYSQAPSPDASDSSLASSLSRTENWYPTSAKEALAAGLTSYYIDPSPMMPPVRFKTNGVWVYLPWEDVYGPMLPIEMKIPLRVQEKFLQSLDGGTESASLADAESEGGGSYGPAGFSNGGCDCPDMGFFRVWHIPDWSYDITNYTYGGATFIPVDFKDYRDRVDNIQLLLNGEPTPNADFMSYASGGQTNWGMWIYFDRLTNGTHQIQLITTLRLNDEIGDNSAFLVLSNLTRSIVVFNQVSFPDWNEFVQGDTYTFNAQTANPDTDWWIDIYDVWGNYVNTGSGHTSNGQVSWTWDLTDSWGNSRDDFDSDPYFYSYITFDTATGPGNGPQSQTTKPTPPPVKGYPNRGEWMVSFQDRWFADAPGYASDSQDKFIDAMGAIRGGPILVGDTAQWYPIRFGTNVYTQADREYSWTNLLAWVGDLYLRNLYYHGHGGTTSIGCDMHTLSTNGFVTGGIMSSSRSKSEIYSWQIAQKTRYKRFRFVFLDGCSTTGGDLPNAFNVSKTNHTIDFYENHSKHPRPSVFVGWSQTMGGEGWGTVENWLTFESYWMGNWANDFDHPSIETSLDRANTGASWVSHDKLWGALRIYGYKDMRMEDYNSKGDWRWP
jgi:hypothetical protein